jgi:hypothetical protein
MKVHTAYLGKLYKGFQIKFHHFEHPLGRDDRGRLVLIRNPDTTGPAEAVVENTEINVNVIKLPVAGNNDNLVDIVTVDLKKPENVESDYSLVYVNSDGLAEHGSEGTIKPVSGNPHFHVLAFAKYCGIPRSPKDGEPTPLNGNGYIQPLGPVFQKGLIQMGLGDTIEVTTAGAGETYRIRGLANGGISLN